MIGWLLQLIREFRQHGEYPRYHFRDDGQAKVGYKSAAGAERAAKRMGAQTGNTFDAYECPYCQGFHIGKNITTFRFKLLPVKR
jgi:hypothetical protein